MTDGPLAGYRIVDLSRVLSGPAATMLLADQGADVIKVEPLEGDITRGMGTAAGAMTAFFLNINRGKRGIALDLKTERGRDVVQRLIKTADVFVQNFRPGVVDKLGIGYEQAKGLNEQLIYVSISGFGNKGPYADKRVYDPVIQALSGITDIQADGEDNRPRMMRTVIPDKTTALTAAQAITAALLGRHRTNTGQHIEIAMLDATIAYMWPEGMMRLTVVGDEPNGSIGQIAQDLVFETQDGFITVGVMSNDQWRGMCTAIERPDWIDDERFNTTAKRFDNARERLQMTGEVLRTKTSEQWLALMDQHAVPCAPILSRLEMLDHPQVRVNEIIREYEQPGLGRVRQPRPAARFSAMSLRDEPVAPGLGEHTEEVLHELGYSSEMIRAMVEQGVIAAREF